MRKDCVIVVSANTVMLFYQVRMTTLMISAIDAMVLDVPNVRNK